MPNPKWIFPLLFSLLLFISTGADRKLEHAPMDLKEKLENLSRSTFLEHGMVGFHAIDLSTGEELLTFNGGKVLTPASTQKLVTTISALSVLEKDKTFQTRIGYNGRVDSGGTLHGSVIIKGGGDPAFYSPLFSDTYMEPVPILDDWANTLKEKGVERVKGDILVDASYFKENSLPRKWIWEDMGNYYGAFPTGADIRENEYSIHFRSADRAGVLTEITRVEPEIPGLELTNRVKSSSIRKDRAYIFGSPYDHKRIIEGTIPAGNSDFSIEGSIPDPPLFFAQSMKKALERAGIKVSGEASTFRRKGKKGSASGMKETGRIASPPLSSIVHQTNMKSHNLFAESLLLHTSKELKGTTDPEMGTEAMLEYLKEKGIDTKGIRLYDGSGLAPSNKLSPRFLCDLLHMAWNSSFRDVMVRSLPVSGVSGSMKYVGENTRIEGDLRAKSGYMTSVRSYSGFLPKGDGGIAFAFIVNDFTCSASKMRRKMEPIMAELAGL